MIADKEKKKPGPVRLFLKEFWIEVLAFVFGMAGILLLVEPFDFRNNLMRFFRSLVSGASTLAVALNDLAQNITLNDLLGWGLPFLAVVFIFWRARVRFLQTSILVASRCPRCDGHLVRVHRRLFDRFISVLTQVDWRRYRCENTKCRWSSLRRRRHHRHHAEGPEEDLPAMEGTS